MPKPDSQQWKFNEEENMFDFLTPEQRTDAVAEILCTLALRLQKQRHEQENSRQ